jgi:hypothetical protein
MFRSTKIFSISFLLSLLSITSFCTASELTALEKKWASKAWRVGSNVGFYELRLRGCEDRRNYLLAIAMLSEARTALESYELLRLNFQQGLKNARVDEMVLSDEYLRSKKCDGLVEKLRMAVESAHQLATDYASSN